ncbi:flagellar assembly protein FliX [Pedomonas sp. V897]|uniref:flagellar assembly protein FliX n=1 Tax=Pedomonas sp. V897 TaxID=3446482 RepID=UPI003EE3BF89
MRIQDPIRTQAATTRRTGDKGGVSGSSGFSSLLGAEEASTASSVATAGPVADIGAILAAQQAEDATQGRSRGLARGRDLLDELEKIQRALLLDTLTVGQLTALSQKLKGYQQVDDPHLADLLAEIELRVAVELAKFGF